MNTISTTTGLGIVWGVAMIFESIHPIHVEIRLGLLSFAQTLGDGNNPNFVSLKHKPRDIQAKVKNTTTRPYSNYMLLPT